MRVQQQLTSEDIQRIACRHCYFEPEGSYYTQRYESWAHVEAMVRECIAAAITAERAKASATELALREQYDRIINEAWMALPQALREQCSGDTTEFHALIAACKVLGARAAAPAGEAPTLSVKRSEWTTLSPEAQAKLEQITGAEHPDTKRARAQAAEDARRIVLGSEASPAPATQEQKP